MFLVQKELDLSKINGCSALGVPKVTYQEINEFRFHPEKKRDEEGWHLTRTSHSAIC